MSTIDETEVDPSVCYRHPGRQSWVLCQRCGRTICPECQILAPVGVQCPECVREAGGSVRWAPAAASRPTRAASSRPARNRPAWAGRVGSLLRPAGSAPAISWGLAGVSLVLWIVGFFSDLPVLLLAALPSTPFEVWRFATGMVVYPAGLSFGGILSFALSMVFWLINAPSAERSMGRARFAMVVLAGGVVGNAAQLLIGGAGYGLYGALFGIFAAYLIDVWSSPPARAQVLIMLGINVVLSVLLGGGLLAEIVGGGLAGAGAYWVLRHYGERARVAARTPYLLVSGGLVLVVVLATVRQLVS